MLYTLLYCLLIIPIFTFSFDCSSQGHLEKSKCICRSGWEGDQCESKVFALKSFLFYFLRKVTYSI